MPAIVSEPVPASASTPIAVGFFSALGASSCCIVPMAAAWAGVGGAWVAGTRMLAPLSPVFLVLAVAGFAWALHRVYLRPACCMPQDPVQRRRQRLGFWSALVAAKALFLAPIVYPLIAG